MNAAAIIAVLASALGGCTDEACLYGACLDYDESRALPGPCRVATDSMLKNCSLSYTTDGQLALARCNVWDSFYAYTEERNTTWSYDSAGQLLEIVEAAHVPRLVFRRWKWEATEVQKFGSGGQSLTDVFDRATFAFYPEGWTRALQPSAELGLRTVPGSPPIEYQWTRTGNQLVRTGSNGSRATAELDDAGRLLSFVGAGRNDRFTYDGDRITSRETTSTRYEYLYDRGGNLVEILSPDAREVYDYSCW